MRILPKEERFYRYFLEQATLLTKASQILAVATRSGQREEIIRAAREINEIETKAGQISRQTYETLHKTFITPIDPEDIHHIADYLFDIINFLEHAAHRLVIYELDPLPKAVIQLTELSERGADLVAQALRAMEAGEPVWEICHRISEVENEGDSVERTAITELFAHEKDAIRLIKHKEILEVLEQVTDRCDDLARVLKNVAVKNA